MIATIKAKRSDLLRDVEAESDPISQHPPPDVAAKFDFGLFTSSFSPSFLLFLFCVFFFFYLFCFVCLFYIILFQRCQGLGIPMLALYAPVSQAFNPVDWYSLVPLSCFFLFSLASLPPLSPPLASSSIHLFFFIGGCQRSMMESGESGIQWKELCFPGGALV